MHLVIKSMLESMLYAELQVGAKIRLKQVVVTLSSSNVCAILDRDEHTTLRLIVHDYFA